MRIPSMKRQAAFLAAGTVLASTAVVVPSLAQAAIVPATAVAQPAAAPVQAADVATPVPAADVLDIDFRGGNTADRAQAITPKTFGEPVFGADASRARSIVSLNGADQALQYPFRAEHAKLNGGFALECTFRFDGPAVPTSEKSICAAKEGGGFAMVANRNGMTFMAHIGGGYKNVSTTLTPGQWYHTLVAWDGEELVLYVDGVEAARTAAKGTYKHPTGVADSFVLGADTQPGNAVSFWSQSSIQNARVWSQNLTAAQAAQLAKDATEIPAAPKADVMDVDFSGEKAVDPVSGIAVREHGTPKTVQYDPLGRKVGVFDGSSAYWFPWQEAQYNAVKNSMTLECYFKYDADAYQSDGDETKGNLCGAKESGGFAIALYGNEIAFNPHIGGSYRNTKHRLTKTDQWVHVVGTYDGSTVKLYVNGQLVNQMNASGAVSAPSNPAARMMVIGGDAAVNRPNYTAPAHIGAARIFSRAIDSEEVLALQYATVGARTGEDLVSVKSSVPQADGRIHRATRFGVEFNNEQAMSRDVVYALDGEPITPGEFIGAGLKAGEHAITVDGTDHFGNVIAERITFTSANIPVAGGTETGQGKGQVSLSSVATNPSGGDVTTEFRAGKVIVPAGGTQGTLKALPKTLEFTGSDVAEFKGGLGVNDGQTIASPAAEGVSYQRFDVEAPAGSTETQQISWTGTVDPTRTANLRVWNGQRWALLDTTRGVAEGNVTLTADLEPGLAVNGSFPVMVTAEDPFADDFNVVPSDSFEKPGDYDFSIAHLTDTQYLAEGAVEQEAPEERAKWKEAYTSITQWIADNAEERKIAFAAHTGDVIENWFTAGRGDDAPYRANAIEEFKVASDAQKILDDAGVVNSVLPGNHDNLYATDNGPDALWNDYFGPERYEALAAKTGTGWQTYNASYHAWKPGDNANSYQLFTASGLDFVVVNLGFGVDAEEVAWANEILKKYSDRNAIVQTHAHTTPSTNPDGRGAGLSYDGNAVRHQVAAKNPNVFLVLSGHEHGVNIEVVRDLGEENNHVVELLADYQFYTLSADELGLTQIGGYNPSSELQFGSSFFRLMQFDVDRAEMSVDTYSAQLDNFGATEYDNRNRYNGTEDDFKLPIQLNTRTTSLTTDGLTVVEPTDVVIGSDTARSGWPTSVVWDGLEAGETYAWYAVTTDAATGEQVGETAGEAAGEVGQLNVFTAQNAGTDKVAPVITAEDVTLVHGTEFDAMAGVTATDAVDGDVTAAIAVTGLVDTTKIGVHTLVYTVADSNGNQATHARTVEVKAPPAPVNTVAPSIEGATTPGSELRLGMGEWTNDENATRQVQWLRDGEPINGAVGGEYVVTAADRGTAISALVAVKTVGNDTVFARAAAVKVAPAQAVKKASKVTVKLSKSKVKAGGSVVATVRVTGAPKPVGKVTVKVGKKSRTVALKPANNGRVQVRLTKLKAGAKQKVVVSYAGSKTLKASKARVLRLTVVR